MKRQEIIDQFIRLKKRKFKSESLLKYLRLQKIIKVLWKKYERGFKKWELKIKGTFMSVMIANRWKKILRSKGKDMAQIIHRRIR